MATLEEELRSGQAYEAMYGGRKDDIFKLEQMVVLAETERDRGELVCRAGGGECWQC